MIRSIGAVVAEKILRATGNQIAAAWLQVVREAQAVAPLKSSPEELLVWSLPGDSDQSPARTIPLALARARRAEANLAS